MIVPDVVPIVVSTYRARRAALLHDAIQADGHHRPIAAMRARNARQVLARAIRAEHVNPLPPGIGSWESL